MKIVQAKEEHKDNALRLLDMFRDACSQQISPTNPKTYHSARENGSDLFDKVVNGDMGAVFLAEEDGQFVGIITIYQIPQIRKGSYVAEVEEMYVVDEYQGTGTAKLLIERAEKWAMERGISVIRLESSNELHRAHGFYEKMGFKHYGKACMKEILK